MRGGWLALLAWLAQLELGGTPLAALPPSNDDFDRSALLEGRSGQVSASTTGATREEKEPLITENPGGRSLWWSWTAPAAGELTLYTLFSDFDTLLAGYSGETLASLELVAENDDIQDSGAFAGLLQSWISFPAEAGRRYHFAVDGYKGESGNVVLTWLLDGGGAPANDDFAARLALAGAAGLSVCSTRQGTREEGEPDHAESAGHASVWWSWTTPAAGIARFTTYTSSFDTVLGVYSGAALTSLELVAENDDDEDGPIAGLHSAVSFPARAGTSYQIAVDGYEGASGIAVLNWTLSPEGADTPFRRGEVVDDGRLNLTDPVAILNFLFLGSDAPACQKSADADDSGRLNVTDALVVLNYLFLGGPPPEEPFERCGPDPTEDAIGCAAYAPCGA